MRNVFLISVLSLFACLQAEGQDIIKRFSEAVASHCVEVAYSYDAVSGVAVSGTGTLRLQGSSFLMKGDGLEIWCDGVTRWTLDREAGEMVVESVEDNVAGVAAADPAVILTSLDTHFTIGSVTKVSGGLTKVDFNPESGVLGISSLSVWLADGEAPVLSRAVMVLGDGTRTELSFSSMKYLAKVSPEEFSFDMKTAGKSWVITDLR
ncbi:MAG: outer membrane lipoprotein carrier protein LolA [Candidatus Cryptobacteroides sp.]